MDIETELSLLKNADRRAREFVRTNCTRRVSPDEEAFAALAQFDEALPVSGADPMDTLDLLDRVGSPAAIASNGPRYFGFVVGATLPAAAAAERMVLAWDQSASTPIGAPGAAYIEQVAERWVLDILDLPRTSAIGFGTSASACGLACLATARRHLLAKAGWDLDRNGLGGAPAIRMVLSDTAHVTVHKALRVLGFGAADTTIVPTDEFGRIDPSKLPDLDDRTILCLQAGEVNSGEFDEFATVIPIARSAGSWVHVDGAFGLWARASSGARHLTEGIDGANSWTVDGHKWLNTPYECAMAICRDPVALAATMTSDAEYSSAGAAAQKNRTMEFSRRARGVAIWAALRSLGRLGVDELIDRNRRQARRLAEGLQDLGVTVLNRVVLNQVLITLDHEDDLDRLRKAVNASGVLWFGPSRWKGTAAARLSVSSWRTTDADIELSLGAFEEAMSRTGVGSSMGQKG